METEMEAMKILPNKFLKILPLMVMIKHILLKVKPLFMKEQDNLEENCIKPLMELWKVDMIIKSFTQDLRLCKPRKSFLNLKFKEKLSVNQLSPRELFPNQLSNKESFKPLLLERKKSKDLSIPNKKLETPL